MEVARPPTIHSPPLFATMVRSDGPTVIVGQTPGELGKTLFAASSGVARGVPIHHHLPGPPIRVVARTNVTVGAASPQGVMRKAAMGPVKPRKTIGLHS